MFTVYVGCATVLCCRVALSVHMFTCELRFRNFLLFYFCFLHMLSMIGYLIRIRKRSKLSFFHVQGCNNETCLER